MIRLKKQIGKIPLLHHLLWKTKMRLVSGSGNVKVVSIVEATSLALKWAKSLPSNYDVIVGVPRSGLWVASILALKFGKPLSTPNAFVKGELWQSLHVKQSILVKRVLLVEDDVLYGKQILKAYRQLKRFNPELHIETASLFATSEGRKLVGYCCQIRNPPLLYEWTLLTNMAGMGKLAVDLDGVLCEECPVNVDLHEAEYVKWLENAKPYLIPQFQIEAVVTSRLERYRDLTEAWLKKHGAQYGKLFMLQLDSKKERTLDAIIQHKVDALRKVKPFWFWESSLIEAQALKSKTHIPILCIANMTLLI